MHKRGQLGIENIILFGALLIFLTAILYVSMELISYNYRVSQLQDAVDMLVLSANKISHLGRGSTEHVDVQLPKGIQSVSVTGNMLAVDYTARGEVAKITGTAEPELIGDIPRQDGRFSIEVTALGDNLVKLGEFPYLWRLEPNWVHFPRLPILVKIHGIDFTPDSIVKLNGGPYPGGFVYWQSSAEIDFDAIPGQMPAMPGGGYVTISVVSNGKESNGLNFYVSQTGNPPW